MEAIGGRSPALASINVHGPVRHLEPKQRAMGGCASQPAAAVKPSIEGEAHSGTEERRVSVVIEQNLSLDFEKVMDAEEGVHALLTFARSEFNDEVLLFWLDIVRLKRDLADASLWSGKGGGCHSNATVSEPTGNATGGGDDNLFDEGNPFDDNPFDADGDAPTHGAGRGKNPIAEGPPPEAETGDKVAYLERKCKYIVDTYLCDGSAFQVTMPDHKFKKKCDEAKPPYSLTGDMARASTIKTHAHSPVAISHSLLVVFSSLPS